MADKVTVMVLKVDLQCPRCYKKVKNILCKFPQIRDQEYDEKGNTVTIKVVCCNPEKIRDKLCSKGRKVIKSIEIKEPAKTKDTEKPKVQEKPKKLETTKEPEKTKETEKTKVVVIENPKFVFVEKLKETPKPAPAPVPPEPPEPVLIFPLRPTCCGECSQGYGGGPCHYGVPSPPQPCYDGYYVYGGRRRGECDYYLVEENPQGCSII